MLSQRLACRAHSFSEADTLAQPRWLCYGARKVASVLHVRWRKEMAERLTTGSRVAETARGPVEYSIIGKGPVALVSHGTPGGYDFGLMVAELFGELPMKFLAVSRPGYLRTPLAAGIRPEEQADAFAALLDTLEIERVTMMGISGGGPAALQFAIRHPQRCRALVLICAVTKALPAEKRSLRVNFLHRVVLSYDVFGWLLNLVSKNAPDALLRWHGVPSPIRKMASTLYPVRLRRPGHQNDADRLADLPRFALEEIRCPTLILHGTKDWAVPFENAEFAASGIQGAEFHPVSGASHSLLALNWNLVSPPMFAFLRKHSL